MLSTDIKQEIILKRVENVVFILMEEEHLFKEALDYRKTVTHLVELFKKVFSLDDFNNISEESLKNRCSGIMSLHLLAKIGEEFTPEQMAIFDEAIKRK